ncbi:unnamed protein product [Mytilus coruscus]|uniref:Uncharacterized protein n=1 Tax=Mytilus coruscus TaxID=42192 RepID=A0A6J8EPF1_MYTCO|nr:unnamed protein product [Mytilus coruscus]
MKGFIHETKQKRNSDARNAMHVISASVSGENISKGEKSKAARKLGLQPRPLSGGQRIRTSVLRSEKSCYEFTKRKTGSDITSDETKNRLMISGYPLRFRAQENLHASNLDLTQENLPVFEHLNDICAETLCDKTAPHAQCLNRSCKECGVEKLSFHDNELDISRNARDIKWEKFEYTEINVKGRKTRTKVMLVSKKTKPGEIFNHFKSLLETFSAHQNRANWQSEQYRNIVQNLPTNHAVCIHDFSENYRCSDRTEIQSAYFQRTEVSIHVTILNRHAILEEDGIGSTLDSPVKVSEQFLVISPENGRRTKLRNI